MGPHASHPEECRKFLFYLLSDDVQREFALMPGEHPVSSNVAPFAGFPDKWRAMLETMKARSRLQYECLPGYWEFFLQDYCTALAYFFHGDIGVTAVIDQVEKRAMACFADSRNSGINRIKEE